MAGKVLKMNTIHKINDSAKMNRSTVNPATAHTRGRWVQLREVKE